MASMKTMMMCVVDAGSAMNEPLEGVGSSKLNLGLTFISTYIVQRMMASKTVEFGVVTYGNDETSNYLNSNQGGYEGVVENVEMRRPTVGDLNTIKNITAGQGSGDLIDGIVVGQDILIRVNNKNKFNRIMLLVTDGETKVEGIEDLEQIVSQMRNITNFGLYVALLGKVTEASSLIKKENAKLLQSLAETAFGKYMEISDIGDSCHLLSAGLGLGTRPQASKTILEIAPNVRIPCVTWGKISKATVPSLKKKAKPAGARADEIADDDGAAGAVKRDTTYRNPEDPDQELGPEEKVKGYKYGAQYVPIAAEDEDMFKVAGPQGVKVIGFLSADRVPRHHYMESATILQGAADNDTANTAVGALATALRQNNQVALVRFVKRENGDPFLAALLPTDDGENVSLMVHRLPCSEDVREYAYPSLITFASEKLVNSNPVLKNRSNAIANFIDTLTVRNVPTATLTPINHVLQEVYTDIYRRISGTPADRVLHAKDPLKNTTENSASDLVDQYAVTVATQQVGATFELVKQEVSTTKRKVFWSEIDIKVGDEATEPGKAPRYELNLNAEAANAVAAVDAAGAVAAPEVPNVPAFTVGSVTPIEDFEAVLAAAATLGAQASEVVREAMRTMEQIIDRNVTIGASGAHYKRAVSCIVAYRAAAVSEGEHAMFNACLRDRVKGQYYAGRHRVVWQMVVDQRITLISSAEDSGSSVSPAEADAFLQEEVVAAPVAAAAAVEEEDDMFGNME